MPADDYSAPAPFTAEYLAKRALIIRAIALALGAASLFSLVAGVIEVLDLPIDWTMILGSAVVALGAGVGGFRLWRSADDGDLAVREPGDPPGVRLLEPLPPATGPLHVPLEGATGEAIVLTSAGMHLPAGVNPTRGLRRRLDKWEASLTGVAPLQLPCFVAWSELVKWSFCTNSEGWPATHRLELTGPRFLQIGKEPLGEDWVTLLDGVRSIGGHQVEVLLPQDSSDSSVVVT